MAGRALQIIKIDRDVGTVTDEPSASLGDSFVLVEENLDELLNKIPVDTKVAVVSVVGAFRTGKSFLLNFFLRYLRQCQVLGRDPDVGEAWMTAEGDTLSEGNMNEGRTRPSATVSTVAEPTEPDNKSFAWRGGSERQTTGIWVWSEPFVKVSSSGQPVAVILMDTQGMFDNETSMALTAQIFGLSTFVSSFQIYNVDKRLQEDNLQHLALFSEYGRLALREGSAQDDEGADESAIPDPKAKLPGQKINLMNITSTHTPSDSTHNTLPLSNAPRKYLRRTLSHTKPPFQRVQFLVRDWQNFSVEWPDTRKGSAAKEAAFTQLRLEMNAYLSSVLRPRGAEDLQSTRDQIHRCFEGIDCFLLPHPGTAVTRRTYSGRVDEIDPFFRALVDQLTREVLSTRLEAKTVSIIGGGSDSLAGDRSVGPRELRTFFQVYVRAFQSGNKGFPKAMTLLDATAEANNRIAAQQALDTYKQAMTALVSDNAPYHPEAALLLSHQSVEREALRVFDEQAGLGAEAAIEAHRSRLMADLEAEWERLKQLNRLRNPYKDVEAYLIPVGVAGGSWALATGLDVWCTSHHCEFVEDIFERVYMFAALAVFGLALLTPTKDALLYTVPLGVAVVSWFMAAVINTSCTTDACTKTGDAFERVYLFLGFSLVVLLYKNFRGAFGKMKDVLLPLLSEGGAKKNN